MEILLATGYGFLVFLVIMFFFTRITIPHMGFTKSELPKNIPDGMKKEIEKLKRQSRNKREFLENAWSFIASKYRGNSLYTLTRMGSHFDADLNSIWKKRGYLGCHLQSLLMRIFLVKSGFFNDDDIKVCTGPYRLNIHQYLKVKIDDKWVPVDVYFSYKGLKIGEKPRWL